MKNNIEVMLVEDNPAYRKGLACALEQISNMELVGEFSAAEFALRWLQENKNSPDILLLDLNLPGMSGIESIAPFKKERPETKIIILTQSDKEEDILRATKLGASGYLLKSTSISQLMDDIESVHAGGVTLDPSVSQFILDSLHESSEKIVSDTDLSNRELEILTLIADGIVQKQIASELKISIYTVTEYIRNIYDKLDVPNAPAAVAKAYKSGIFPPQK